MVLAFLEIGTAGTVLVAGIGALSGAAVATLIGAIALRRVRAAEARKIDSEAKAHDEDSRITRVKTLDETIKELLDRAKSYTHEILDLQDQLRSAKESHAEDLVLIHGKDAIIAYQREELRVVHERVAAIASSSDRCKAEISSVRTELATAQSQIASLQTQLETAKGAKL